jgi:hypothetical protein
VTFDDELTMTMTTMMGKLHHPPQHDKLMARWSPKSCSPLTGASAPLPQGLKIDCAHGALWSVYGCLEDRLGNMDEARNIFETGLR